MLLWSRGEGIAKRSSRIVSTSLLTHVMDWSDTDLLADFDRTQLRNIRMLCLDPRSFCFAASSARGNSSCPPSSSSSPHRCIAQDYTYIISTWSTRSSRKPQNVASSSSRYMPSRLYSTALLNLALIMLDSSCCPRAKSFFTQLEQIQTSFRVSLKDLDFPRGIPSLRIGCWQTATKLSQLRFRRPGRSRRREVHPGRQV